MLDITNKSLYPILILGEQKISQFKELYPVSSSEKEYREFLKQSLETLCPENSDVMKSFANCSTIKEYQQVLLKEFPHEAPTVLASYGLRKFILKYLKIISKEKAIELFRNTARMLDDEFFQQISNLDKYQKLYHQRYRYYSFLDKDDSVEFNSELFEDMSVSDIADIVFDKLSHPNPNTVQIIEDIQALNQVKMSSFLKLIEEPQAPIILMSMTDKILPTIISRCRTIIKSSNPIPKQISLQEFTDIEGDKDIRSCPLSYFLSKKLPRSKRLSQLVAPILVGGK